MEGEEKADSPDTTTTITINGGGDEKKPLKIDFDSLFAADRDRPPDELVVVSTAASDKRRRSPEKRKRPKENSSSASSATSEGEDFSRLSEAEIASSIERQWQTFAKFGDKLPDKGAKLKAAVKSLQTELERRKLRPALEDAALCKKPIVQDKKSVDSGSSNSNGVLEGLKLVAPSSQASGQSMFAACFMKKLEDGAKPKAEPNTDDQASTAFDREISSLKCCDKRRRKAPGKILQSKRSKPGLCSKEFSAWQPINHSRNGQKYMSLNGLIGRASSKGSLPLTKESLVGSLTDKDASQPLSSDGWRKEKTVVLVDEEEPELVQQKQEAEQLPSSTDEGKIYYPSREDPESLEIFHSELKCLEPGECLTSTIMNFYIRFLQELWSPTDRSQHNIYFFNTYFYSKLQKAVEYQRSDKEAFFIKFRRWWRGVNIFQKAYIFLPINEDNHWSLMIICIPDEEDESGPIILHLDSLGLHCSRSIFHNIKSLLIHEWEYLKGDNGGLDIPIPDRVWKFLPRRIDEKIITVPRQTNDYDCGLFVLYYMERFIKEAPHRLKRQHLSMFGKNWFKPQEASSLRWKIKNILQEQFHKAPSSEKGIWEPVCLSANAQADKSRDQVNIS